MSIYKGYCLIYYSLLSCRSSEPRNVRSTRHISNIRWRTPLHHYTIRNFAVKFKFLKRWTFIFPKVHWATLKGIIWLRLLLIRVFGTPWFLYKSKQETTPRYLNLPQNFSLTLKLKHKGQLRGMLLYSKIVYECKLCRTAQKRLIRHDNGREREDVYEVFIDLREKRYRLLLTLQL